MNTRALLPALFCTIGVLGAAAVTPADLTTARAEVIFFEPESYTDVRSDAFGHERDRAAYLGILGEHIAERVARWLPAGHRLTVTITDVDMAGEFEPWRGPQFHDIRIVKDIYPPRIDLEFKLTNARGEVLQEGSRQLRDLNFMMNLSLNRQDSLRHEKELIDAWLKREFVRERSS